METINIRKSDLEILIEGFSDWVREDSSSRDYCRFCGKLYGNVSLMKKRGERIGHSNDCPVLVAQDLSTGL